MAGDLRRLTVLLLAMMGCAPEARDPQLHHSVTGAVGQVLHPSDVYVRFFEPEKTLVVFERLDGPELGRGPATVDAVIPVKLGGHPCELVSHGTEVETETLTQERPPDSTTRGPMPSRERKTLVAKVTLRCSDGPVPGIRPAPSLPPTDVLKLLPFVLLIGALAAFLYRRGDDADQLGLQLAGIALGLIFTVAAFVFGWKHFDGLFCLTVPLLEVVTGVFGAVATLLLFSDRKTRTRVGAGLTATAPFVGAGVIALLFPLWAPGAPVAALGLSLVVALVGLFVAVE